MSTFETIDFVDEEEEEKTRKTDDLSSAFVGLFSTLNLKMMLFLFLIYIFVSSDIFIEKILGRIDGATNLRESTIKGTFIQGFVVVFLYMILDLVTKVGVI